MKNAVLIAGAGKIGTLIACLLMEAGDFDVHVVDTQLQGPDFSRLRAYFPAINAQAIDVTDRAALGQYVRQHRIQSVLSCLPYFCNENVAQLARQEQLHYFDLTEDVAVTQAVRSIAEGASTAFVPQCGLAPGFISIAANALMQRFDSIDTVKMRVGALPQYPSNGLLYALTWSTDGLINEYGNLCSGIENGKSVSLHPLEGLELLQIDGTLYEAFNTSGGLGSLPELYAGRVRTMNYKTVRYPGHCEKMSFLMNDLRLNEDRATLKRILENTLPKTYQDVVLVYVSVTGHQNGVLLEDTYVNKVYPREIAGLRWSAIQVTTAAGIATVLDLVLSAPEQYRGFVYQENFALEGFLENRFGRYYQPSR